MNVDGQAEAAILEVGKRWADAELNGDTDGLADLLADDFTGVGPRGFLLDKQAWLARHASGALRHEEFSWQDVAVRGYGDTAVAVGIQEGRGSYGGQSMSGRFRVTQVLVRAGGAWMIAGLHLSPVTAP